MSLGVLNILKEKVCMYFTQKFILWPSEPTALHFATGVRSLYTSCKVHCRWRRGICKHSLPTVTKFYVYWTVHHCDSWRIRDMFRTLIHPSSGACDFSIVSPHWSCVLVSMFVGVSVWLGWVGIRVSSFSLLHTQAPDDDCINVRNMLSIEEVK